MSSELKACRNFRRSSLCCGLFEILIFLWKLKFITWIFFKCQHFVIHSHCTVLTLLCTNGCRYCCPDGPAVCRCWLYRCWEFTISKKREICIKFLWQFFLSILNCTTNLWIPFPVPEILSMILCFFTFPTLKVIFDVLYIYSLMIYVQYSSFVFFNVSCTTYAL